MIGGPTMPVRFGEHNNAALESFRKVLNIAT